MVSREFECKLGLGCFKPPLQIGDVQFVPKYNTKYNFDSQFVVFELSLWTHCLEHGSHIPGWDVLWLHEYMGFSTFTFAPERETIVVYAGGVLLCTFLIPHV